MRSRRKPPNPDARGTFKTRFINAAATLKSNVQWLIVTIAGLTAGTAAFVANFESLNSQATTYLRNREYLQSLEHPYPSLLKESDIDSWNLGSLELAVYQIDGYLGRLRAGPSWIKACLTDESIFPNHSRQYNDRMELPESVVDRENKALLLRQIDKREIQPDLFLRINDPFERLLERASSALLRRHKETEIGGLDRTQLYLLRNAIYARHGRPFDTAKLEKYANRKGWQSRGAAFTMALMSPVELCNALYLNELHAARELGALGRGILVRQAAPPAMPTFLKASLCSCLAQPKILVDCREKPGGNERDEYRDYVDLVVDFVLGNENTVEWTLLDPQEVAAADLDSFRSHEDIFLSSALNFNAAVQSSLQVHDAAFHGAPDRKIGPFWGARLTLTQETLAALASNPMFLSEFAGKICRAVQDSLDAAGPFIPRMEKRAPAVVGSEGEELKIFQKPILFDPVRATLTREYVSKHYGDPAATIELAPKMIVIHRSNIDTLAGSYETLRLPVSSRSNGAGSGDQLNASVHYLVDRDGAVYNLMMDFYVARHVAGLDRVAIGISNVATDALPATEAQLHSDAKLVRFLVRKYGKIKWLIGAFEGELFKDSDLWGERDKGRGKVDDDPGKEWMVKLREQLGDLKLKATP